MNIVEENGKVYFEKTPFEMKDYLKGKGCKWDPGRKAWWLKSGDDEIVEEIKTRLLDRDPPPRTVVGQATYRGRAYWLAFHGPTKFGMGAKLIFEDGSKEFWAKDVDEVVIIGKYPDKTKLEDAMAGRAKLEPIVTFNVSENESDGRRATGKCRGCGGPVRDAKHHAAMEGYCGSCAFDEFDL